MNAHINNWINWTKDKYIVFGLESLWSIVSTMIISFRRFDITCREQTYWMSWWRARRCLLRSWTTWVEGWPGSMPPSILRCCTIYSPHTVFCRVLFGCVFVRARDVRTSTVCSLSLKTKNKNKQMTFTGLIQLNVTGNITLPMSFAKLNLDYSFGNKRRCLLSSLFFWWSIWVTGSHNVVCAYLCQ